MRRCWAEPLGGCDDISKEHYFTNGLFGTAVATVSGLPFLKGTAKKLRCSVLTAHCLCRRHNSQLHDLDQAAIDVMNAIRRLRELRAVRRALACPAGGWRRIRLTVDGARFERWMMKVALNVAHLKEAECDGWRPSRELVEAVFGRRPLPGGAGAAVIGSVGQTFAVGEQLGVVLVHDQKAERPAGAALSFAGYPFLCTWEHAPANVLPCEIKDAWYETAAFHCRNIADGDTGTCLTFEWSGGWRPNDHPAVVALRTRRWRRPRTTVADDAVTPREAP
jgi:hypothetical protein